MAKLKKGRLVYLVGVVAQVVWTKGQVGACAALISRRKAEVYAREKNGYVLGPFAAVREEESKQLNQRHQGASEGDDSTDQGGNGLV